MKKVPVQSYAVNYLNMIIIDEEEKEGLEPIIDQKVCDSCIAASHPRAKLNCGHSICNDCLLMNVMTNFINHRAYKYSIHCSTCKEVKVITSLFLECGCEWDSIGEDKYRLFRFKEKLVCYRCEKNHVLTFTECSIINDYDSLITLSKYLQNWLLEKNEGKSLFNLSFNFLFDAGAISVSKVMESNYTITSLVLSIISIYLRQ